MIDFGVVYEHWRNVSFEAEQLQTGFPNFVAEADRQAEGRYGPAANNRRLTCDNLCPRGVVPLCDLLRPSRRSLVSVTLSFF